MEICDTLVNTILYVNKGDKEVGTCCIPSSTAPPCQYVLCITCVILYSYKAPLWTLILITLRWRVITPFYRQRKMSSYPYSTVVNSKTQVYKLPFIWNTTSKSTVFLMLKNVFSSPISWHFKSKHFFWFLIFPPYLWLHPACSTLYSTIFP